MIRRLGVGVSVLLCLAAVGCGREPAGRSPFSGSGASDRRGVLAVAHLSRELLSADWIPELIGELIPEDVELTWVWLDAQAYGGSQAFLLQGRDPEHVVLSLLQSGLLVATDRPDTYRLEPEGWPVDSLDAFLRWTPGGLTGSALKSGDLLKRYDRGNRLVLVPTIDLREWMFDLADALERQPEPAPQLALALDGRSLARLIREQIQPRLLFFHGLAAAAAGGGEDAHRLTHGVFAMRLLLEAVTQLEGAVLSLADKGSYHWDARLTALSDSPLQLYFESFEPLPAPSDSEVSDGRAHLTLALHPERYSRALGRLAKPALDHMSLEYVEQFETIQELTRTHFGGLLFASLNADGWPGLALSLKPGTRRADLILLDRFWQVDMPWRLEQGCLIIGDGHPDPPAQAGLTDLVGRIWGQADILGPGTQSGELRRIERGLWFQFDASLPD